MVFPGVKMEKFICSNGVFSGKGNVEIFTQRWLSDQPKAVLILVHGLGEHSGRYAELIESLKGKNISVYALDHRGHGKSEGIRGHINSFMDYIYDLKIFINSIKQDNPDLPLVMLGHSLGGAIACRYALTYQNDIDALVLSAPGLIPAVKIPSLKITAAKILSAVLPTFSMSNGLDPAALSHDEEIVSAYINDSLVHGFITPRFYTEFTENAVFCMDRASQLRMPLLLIHGTGDTICSVKGTEILYSGAEAEDKELLLFPNLYHETMNEIKKDRIKVISAISKWIVSHSQKQITNDRTIKKEKPAMKKASSRKSVKAKKNVDANS
jgi:alpha-beta hydrolase superfamily lysophospholipase